jgi:uncharacterized protein YjbI with pentapeptide repeats
MEEIKGRTYSDGETIDIDGNIFTDCRFEQATLRYAGGPHPVFNNCDFSGAGWHFSGAALRTIQLLQQINASPGGPGFVADLFVAGKYFADE